MHVDLTHANIPIFAQGRMRLTVKCVHVIAKDHRLLTVAKPRINRSDMVIDKQK